MAHETPEMHEKHTKHDEHGKKISIGSLLALGIVGSLLLGAIIVGGIGYAGAKNGPDSAFAIASAKFFRMPVASVNGEKILYADYKEDIDTLTRFYGTVAGEQPAPSPEQLSSQVLSRQMANAIVDEIADDLSVTVKEEQVEEAKKAMFAQFPSEEDARKDLLEKYGWTIEKYVEKVVRPILLEQAVAEAFQATDKEEYKKYETGEEVKGSHILLQVEDEKSRNDVKKLAEDILAKVKKGDSFEDLAKQYGSDGTKEQGGDLGWFQRGVMVKPFEDAMFALKDGEIGSLVETEFGYHIIKRTGTRKAKDFNAFMGEKIKDADIKMYMNLPNPLEEIFTEEQPTVDLEAAPEAEGEGQAGAEQELK